MRAANRFGKSLPIVGMVWLVVTLPILTSVTSAVGQASISHQIRESVTGPVGCVVHIPATRSANPATDRVPVDVRLPATPSSGSVVRARLFL